jgi:hypothetical protein
LRRHEELRQVLMKKLLAYLHFAELVSAHFDPKLYEQPEGNHLLEYRFVWKLTVLIPQ